MTDSIYDSLTQDQKDKVYSCGGEFWTGTPFRRMECAGCTKYLGATALGENTTFWHYGASSGYVALPFPGEPHFSYDSGLLYLTDPSGIGREFALDGEDVTPPFWMLVHINDDKWGEYVDFVRSTEGARDPLVNEDTNAGSSLPEHAARRLGLDPDVIHDFVGHMWVKPWEISKGLMDAALAITAVFRGPVGSDDRKVVIL